MQYHQYMVFMRIFFGIFIIVSAAHIVFISLQKEKLRRVSKVLIIPFLLAFYIAAAKSPLVFPILALVFGWIGDILLINKRRRMNFKLGLASFLLGHICYVFTFVNRLRPDADDAVFRFNPTVALICIPLAVALGILMLKFVKPNKEMLLPVIFYLIGIVTMSFWALELFVCAPGPGGALILSGSLCFIVSDTMLGYYTFRKLKLVGSVLIMLFYVLAQAGIILGLVCGS
jgi:uncharacterized membrane protein YhhN